MRQTAQCARQELAVRSGAVAPAVPLRPRPLPRGPRRPRLVAALLWLVRLLFVQPVGRRARAERLRVLPDRTLRDIGLSRPGVEAAAWGMMGLGDLVQHYPSAGPLYVCGCPGFRPTLVRLDEAA